MLTTACCQRSVNCAELGIMPPIADTACPVRVINPNQLFRLLDYGRPSPDEDRTSLIAAKIEALCRDVEY